jgi:acyl-CoA synthetase (AMP-forming)/AMP-acid ligase II
VPVKEQMIAWWGPIIFEYYGATEGHGLTACDSAEWLAHRGTVGRVLLGELHVLDEDMRPVPVGTPGTLWFKTASPFEYFKDPISTNEARSPDSTMSTVGDVGYVDEDGYVYLTDRQTFMIISGGVNIYPQECENLLITHPEVADAAVFGVPNADLGEEVKAVVQPMPGIRPTADFAEELIAFCRRTLPISNARARSTSKRNCRGFPPASCTSACSATGIGARGRAASCRTGAAAPDAGGGQSRCARSRGFSNEALRAPGASLSSLLASAPPCKKSQRSGP